MQRCLMTTIHMFKNHPYKKNIKFIVLPIAREVLGFCCDISMDVNELVEKYANGKPITCGINFDFSALYQNGVAQLWQISTLADITLQKEAMLEIISANESKSEVSHQAYLDSMIKIFARPEHKP